MTGSLVTPPFPRRPGPTTSGDAAVAVGGPDCWDIAAERPKLSDVVSGHRAIGDQRGSIVGMTGAWLHVKLVAGVCVGGERSGLLRNRAETLSSLPRSQSMTFHVKRARPQHAGQRYGGSDRHGRLVPVGRSLWR